jgi:hypothetical protein
MSGEPLKNSLVPRLPDDDGSIFITRGKRQGRANIGTGLNEILDRPKSERPFLLLVVGYPADDAEVPDIQRKSLNEYTSFIET